MSEILFASVEYDRYDASVTLPAKFERMLEASSLKAAVSGKLVAVKMHVGRGIGYTTIHPLFVRSLVEKLKGWGARVFITDQEVDDARIRGYTEEMMGCPIVDACGVTGKYFYPTDVDFRDFKNVDIAGTIRDADVMVNLSHVKGHGSCGYGGACKNIAMGCVTGRTRGQIHHLEGGIDWDEDKCTHCGQCVPSCNHDANEFDEDGKYSINFHHCTFCQHCVKVCPTGALTMDDNRFGDFQIGMALCTKQVLDVFEPGNVFHINFMTQMTALCDCWGLSTSPVIPDVGIAMSEDIVAIEKCCLDMTDSKDFDPKAVPKGYEMGEIGHLFQRLHFKDPYVQVRELENCGLGTQQYTVREIS